MALRKVISRSIQDSTIDLQVDAQATTRNTLRPSLSLNFINSKVVDPRIKIQRNSRATVVNSSGYIEVVDANDGRITHNPVTKQAEGLLIEESRYNYVRTQALSMWSMSGPLVESGVTVLSPAGIYDTYALYESASSTYQRFQEIGSSSIASGSRVWVTIYAKKGLRKYLTIDMAPTAYYDLDAGTCTVPSTGIASMEDAGNGWWKCVYSWVTTATGNQTVYFGTSSTGADGGLYVGNVASPAIYLWGAQMEVGAYATSLIPLSDDNNFNGRETTATYTDGSGRVRTAPANILRSGYRFDGTSFKPTGPLIERGSTNLINYSTFVGTGWNQTLASGIVAPDGNTGSVATKTGSMIGRDAVSSYANSVQTYSLYVKAADSTDPRVRLNVYCGVSGSDYGVGWNLSTEATYTNYGAGLISYKMQPTGYNGWYRISMTFLSPANTTTINCQVHFDGTSAIYFWGCQLEQTPYPTSYIPTSGSAAARANDNSMSRSPVFRDEDKLTIQGSDFSNFFNQAEGTFVADYKMNYLDAAYNNPIVYANDGTSSNYLAIFGATANYGWAQTSKGTSAGISGGNTSIGVNYSLAFAYKANDFAVSVNGGSVQTDTSGIVPQVNQLAVGWRRDSSNKTANGTIKKIVYYPLRVSNADLVELTS